MQIIGVSFDDPETNDAWGIEHQLPYELWTDDTRALALAFGAANSPTQGSARRVTVLLDEDGEVWLEYPQVAAGSHPADVLADIEQLLAP